MTGIGSVPHTDPADACELILRTFDIPFWPQLPKISFKESMIAQYSEGMPNVRINEQGQSIRIDRAASDEIDRFYESWTEETKIAMSDDYARGLHAFLRRIRGRRFRCLKGHITGPVTFTLGLKDSDGKLVFYDEELREISLMVLKAKARWQIDLLRQHADDVILFVDEPILSALGSSSYLGISNDEVRRLLEEITSSIRQAGAMPGIHCCGRADWSVPLHCGTGILSFDSFEYFDSIAIYADEVRAFLEAGGYLAWGMVPTSDAISDIDDIALISAMEGYLETLASFVPRELLLSRILLTPACGTGTRTVEETIKAFQLLIRLKEGLREQS